MSKPHARRARAEFDAMIEERNAAKRARRPVVALHGPVVTVVILPVYRPTSLQAIHAAADAIFDCERDEAHARMLDSMLDARCSMPRLNLLRECFAMTRLNSVDLARDMPRRELIDANAPDDAIAEACNRVMQLA